MTAAVFLDLLMLSLLFRSEREKGVSIPMTNTGRADVGVWSTVDRTGQVLILMGIMSGLGRKALYENGILRVLLQQNSTPVYAPVNDGVLESETKQKLVTRAPETKKGERMSREQMFANMRIFLSRRGRNAALVVEKDYPWFTREKFLAAYDKRQKIIAERSVAGREAYLIKHPKKVVA